MRSQKRSDLVFTRLCRLGPGETARCSLAQTSQVIVTESNEQIDRSCALAAADSQRITFFQADVSIANIQMLLPKDRSARLEIKGPVIRLVILVTLPGKKKPLTAR